MMLLKKLNNQSTEEERKVILRKIKEIAVPTLTSLKEPSPVIPKGRLCGTKKRLSQKAKKHASLTKRDPSGFEYAKTGEELELARKIFDQFSQVSKPRKKMVKKLKVHVTPKVDVTKLEFIPEFMHQFVLGIDDVIGDDHCGFRCVAKQLELKNGKHDWTLVRTDLLRNLERFKDKYDLSWGSWFYNDNRSILDYFDAPIAIEKDFRAH